MPHTHYLTALNFYRNGQLTQAELGFQQTISIQANHADAYHMLGIICYQTNRAADAVRYIQQALAISPRNVDYLNNCGLALRANNELEAAIKSFQQAVLLQPKDLDVQLNLGNTLLAVDRFEEAAGYYRRVLRAMPKKEDVREALCHCLTSLGNQAHAMGNFTQAATSFEEALQFNPQDAALLYNLGNAQRELGRPTEAAKQYQKAIQINPNDADTYNNLGNVQRELGQLDLAIESYQKALQLNPQLHHAKVHLVHQKQHICDWQGLDHDIAEICHWVTTQPSAQISPFAFLAMPNTTAEQQKICANNWVKNRYGGLIQHRQQLRFTPHEVTHHKQTSQKKLKLGYLSADFRLHPLAFLISELIELHDRSQFEIVGFSYGVNDKSSARARLEQAFDQFHDIRQLSEIEAAKKIYASDIDILIDLTGFTQTSRSGIAALRPAPINVSWLGFPGTMGAFDDEPLFDYLLTDNFISPPASASHYAEQLAVLPHSYQPNDRKRPVGKTPTRKDCNLPEGAFVFCCFNQSFKITPDVFSIWMRVLNAVPNSVLWLLDCNMLAKQNLMREAVALGIAAERLIFAPRVAIAEHLARHAHADLFLDTLPYNAHTTCSDALWMGVPVLTCAGETFAARVAGSLISAAGLTELMTCTLQDYEQKALQLANNPAMITAMKQKLLAEKMTSALFDTHHFAQSLEAIYQAIWQQSANQNMTQP
ncbi:MAG: tetratricopeptide repeat protein [Methylotenera sp.]|nr:tetratricopeptide repeat protein [Methylotenera sp.]